VIGHPAISVLVCLMAAYGLAIAIHPATRRRGVLSLLMVGLACYAIILSLLFIPPEPPVLRALTSLLCVDLFFRLIDFTRQSRRGDLPAIGWSGYCRFLIPFPLLLVMFGQKDRRLGPDQPRGADILRVVLGAAGVVVGFVLIFAAEDSTLLQSSFLLDHIVKLFIFVLTVESTAQALCGLERLLGFDTTPIIDRAFLARTPAEFWRRWNNRINAWLFWNAFTPAGGRRAPLCGVWATCLFSAVLHEVAFTIATSRFTGYQFIFFLIQAPAIALSPALGRLSRDRGIIGIVFAHTVTVLWMAFTSMFFFHGVDLIFPFMYTSEPWLP
jgi:hypothetical protein